MEQFGFVLPAFTSGARLCPRAGSAEGFRGRAGWAENSPCWVKWEMDGAGLDGQRAEEGDSWLLELSLQHI